MSSSKDSMKKRGTSTSLEKSKADRGPGSEMPTSRRAGRRSLYVKVGRKRADSGQYQRVEAMLRRFDRIYGQGS